MPDSSDSIFTYAILNNHSSPSAYELSKSIEEELNRGLSFIISESGEKVVPLKGRWSEWAKANVHDNTILIEVKDSFFKNDSIIAQILTSLLFNLLDFGKLRLIDIKLSKNIHGKLLNSTSNQIVLESLGQKPFLGTQIKPSYGYSKKEKLQLVSKLAKNGLNFIKEDETYFVDKNTLILEAQELQAAINEVSNKCFYVPHITSHIHDDDVMSAFSESGIKFGMVNYLVNSLPSIIACNVGRHIQLWGHRVGYESMKEFISMKAIILLAQYSGINMLHIGTPHYGDEQAIQNVSEITQAARNIKLFVPIFTKTSPAVIPQIEHTIDKPYVLMACGYFRSNGVLDWNKIMQWINSVQN
jgi:ribulose 1,5-bisphosphate carboxylase large subunit-like protein